MPGWTWDYVEQTVTAARLDALTEAMKPPTKTKRVSLDAFRAQFPNGIKAGE